MLPNYPRSFGRLLAIGFSLVALPPVIGLISNAISITQLTDRSEHAVYQAVRVTQAGRRLLETTTALERNARQFLIVPGEELFDAYLKNRESMNEVIAELSASNIDPEQHADLDEIVADEARVYAALSDHPDRAADLRVAVRGFARINELAQGFARAGNERIDREVEALRETASKARQVLYWQLFALVPIVVFTAIGFALLIGRPIRVLDTAIQRLGSGQLTGPVVVDGPQDLKDLGRRLEWMRNELINIEREKNRFLREISHSLKTPLAALREGSALLTEEALGSLTPEQREITGILHRNSLELQRLIEELLDYDAVQFKRTILRFSKIELQALAQQMAANHRLALQAKRLTIEQEVPDIKVRADAEKITEILDNLLSNAIKYSPDNGRIVLKMTHHDNDLIIDVIDQGPGVALEDRPRIFDPFYRGHRSPAGSDKGSGVGLSIVREYAIAHGGNAHLMQDASGTHFRVTLLVGAIA